MIRKLFARSVACAFLVAALGPWGLGGVAAATEDEVPVAGDDRAAAHAGNSTTCSGAGLTGDIVTLQTTTDGTYLTIVSVPDGITLTGIVVKGGPAYNVYPGTVRDRLHSPINRGGNVPAISHWFACGAKTATTSPSPSPSPAPKPSATMSTTVPSGGTPSNTPSSPVAAAPGGSGSLANTGFSAGPVAAVALGLVALGVALLLAQRRFRRP